MKRKILYLSFILALLFNSCKNDFLEVNSKSKVSNEFMFQSTVEADKAVLGVYELVRSSAGIHGSGLCYDVLAVGSDIEIGPELPLGGGRYAHGNFYALPPQLSDAPVGPWNGMYAVINRCNILINGFESNAAFIAADKTKPSQVTHLYGEVIALRATMYYELTKCWGDVLYFTSPINSKADYETATVTDRSLIEEGEIANLIKVEPMMYHLTSGDKSKTAERMTKEYVQGLIGRMALVRGGYELRPATYTGNGDVIQSHTEWGKMVRRTDWKNYYTTANTYLKKVVNEGTAVLTTTDPRTPASKYSNPFQYFFQQCMDYKISSESIFEMSERKGTTSDWPYAFGRPSDGGGTGYPPKAYGQVRFFPTFYYGMFNPKDLRRDVTVTVTALGGVANEKIMSLKKGNKSLGGLSLNKYDYSRMSDKTFAVNQRQTGTNAPMMRLADIILLLSETYAVLGDEASAKAELLKVRKRAFNLADAEYTALTTTYVNSLSGVALMNAIQDERAFELAGEAKRRFDLVRWGLLGKKVNQLQTEMDAIINGLNTTGSYTFANGNVISSYIYIKDVTKTVSGLSDILTTTCDVDKTNANYPILYPGWRGTATDWVAPASVKLLNVSVAIQGLFEPISASQATSLVAAGYKKTSWGVDLIPDANGWKTGLNGAFGGYLPASYTANYPPRYILAIPATTIAYSKGMVSNSYGFPNQ